MHKFITFVLLLAGYSSASLELMADPLTIMPMGDSITVGVDYYTDSTGGYRDPLYTDLVNAGITPQFEGATDTSPTTLLTSTGNQYHNGYGSYHIQDITNNLNGDVQPSYGDSNMGGYWLTGGNGTGRGAEDPNIILLEIGTNDFLQQQQVGIDQRLDTLVTTIHSLSPNTLILVGGAIPINDNPGFNAEISAYDSYIENTMVPSLSYTRYVDLYDDFVNSDGSTISSYYGTDNIHPDSSGYPVMAATWAAAIEQDEGAGSVPEPSTMGLFGFGLLGLALFAGKRKLGFWLP
jgi:hypothetical protein